MSTRSGPVPERTRPVVGRADFKQCCTCKGWFQFAAFYRDVSPGRSGWQPQCRRCRTQWEHDGAWCRFRSYLKKFEPAALAPPHGWTEELYRAQWDKARGCCEWCGAGLGEWQLSGHRVDAIDNDREHTPNNCQLLCWVCNRLKSNHPNLATKQMVVGIVVDAGNGDYERGRGKVQWSDRFTWARRAKLPDVEQYRVASPQLEMFP